MAKWCKQQCYFKWSSVERRSCPQPTLGTWRAQFSFHSVLRQVKGQTRPAALPWYPRVVPGADACLRVEEVDLALHCGALLCMLEEKVSWAPTLINRKCNDGLLNCAELTVSLRQVGGLVPRGSVLRGVAVASGVLPPDSLRLEATLLTGRVEPAVAAARSASGVGVRKRLFAEVAFKDRPNRHRQTDSVGFSLTRVWFD